MFSKDSPHCSLKGVKNKGNCKKPNGRKKFWMTFQYGYGMLEIKKFDTFSNLFSSSDTTSSSGSGGSGGSGGSRGGSSSSSFQIPQKFAISAIYFRVRGAQRILIKLLGDVGQTVSDSLFRVTIYYPSAFRHGLKFVGQLNAGCLTKLDSYTMSYVHPLNKHLYPKYRLTLYVESRTLCQLTHERQRWIKVV